MTKKAMIESIMRIIKGGNVRSSSQLHEKDVEASMNRAIALLLKTEAIDLTYPFGTSIPTHHLIATYENVPVTDLTCDRSKATLPAIPISLPMGLGVWRITKTGCYDYFIPLEPGMLSVSQGVTGNRLAVMLADDKIPYEVAGNQVTFGKSKADVGDTVTIQLLISDISEIDEYQQLPIPGDLEAKVVGMVRQELLLTAHDNSNDGNDQS